MDGGGGGGGGGGHLKCIFFQLIVKIYYASVRHCSKKVLHVPETKIQSPC